MNVRRSFAALVLAGAVAAMPVASKAAVAISVTIAPPVLPVYEQPVCPGDGYMWTPGYWAWDPSVADYYWVPGTWVEAPQTGYLWTPGYWGYGDGVYLWNAGYWGPHIGFYGGVNYGFGYGGVGFEGGYWNGGHFFYNTAILHVGPGFGHVYAHPVPMGVSSHVAFNGGPGGIAVRPSPGELGAFHENHVGPTGVQMQHASFAQQDRGQFNNVNHGQPGAAAMSRPAQSAGALRGGNVVSGTRPAVNGFAEGHAGGEPAARNAYGAAGNRAPVQSVQTHTGQTQHAAPAARPSPSKK